ncbi:MAG: PIG-L family deacetylase [Chitinophagales bacterium]
MLRISAVLFLILFTCLHLSAEKPQNLNAGEIQLRLEKLNTLGTALYIAAHPDDENTRLITWLSKKRNIRSGYLSLTRGDGGQNMIGTEIGSYLGIIRTQELLAARRIDGGHQFFTRAVDFGYSKTSDESLNIWNEAQVLEDMVYVIRQFRPDVLITRFPPSKYNYPTHGHHSASADLAEKAFEMAGDPEAFPEQLKTLETWSPKRLYWNTSPWFYRRTGQELDTTDKIIVDIGAYLPELGLSCSEIAAESRSQHKSQGFGSEKTRGEQPEYLEYVMGDTAKADLFDDVNLTWGRIDGAQNAGLFLNKAAENFDPKNPTLILPALLTAYKELQKIKGSHHYVDIKLQELSEVIYAICGLHLEALAENYYSVAGNKIKAEVKLLNRSDTKITVESIQFNTAFNSFEMPENLENNKEEVVEAELQIADDALVNQAYWLREAQENIGMFKIPGMEYTGMPENDVSIFASVKLNIQGAELEYQLPLQYKWTDRVKGELYRPFFIAPDVSLNLGNDVFIFPSDEAREISIKLKSWKENLSGTLKLDLPKGWKSEPEEIPLSLEEAGKEKNYAFNISPSKKQKSGAIKPVFVSGEKSWNRSFVNIEYDHIPYQSIFPDAEAKLLRLESAQNVKKVGYIMGAGDLVNKNLEEAGYEVSMIDEDNFDASELSQFPTILIGVRAYNTEEWLLQKYDALMDYVKNGGTLIVQYQTKRGLLTDKIGPYPFEIDHGRVTVEEAEMRILDSGKKLASEPNKLGKADFEGWVQERGLYFAQTWDERYQTVFEMNDPGEESLQGSVLIAPYGKGHFMYTGISFFRELPAGVPGAFRLLSNMIDYGK